MAACCGLAKVPGFVQRYEKSQLFDIQWCVSDKWWPYPRGFAIKTPTRTGEENMNKILKYAYLMLFRFTPRSTLV